MARCQVCGTQKGAVADACPACGQRVALARGIRDRGIPRRVPWSGPGATGSGAELSREAPRRHDVVAAEVRSLIRDQPINAQVGLLSWILERIGYREPVPSGLEPADQVHWAVLRKLDLDRAEELLRWLKRRLAQKKSISPRR